jgi:hypothetical protein
MRITLTDIDYPIELIERKRELEDAVRALTFRVEV